MVGRVGLIFLRSDENNYYAIEINGAQKGDVRLIHLQEGAGSIVATADGYEILPKVWTTFRVVISD